MTKEDKIKLNGIATNANNYTYSLPTASSSTKGGIKTGFAASGKNYPVQMSGENAYVNVPWTDTNTTYGVATQSANGLMSAADKKKLDRINIYTFILNKPIYNELPNGNKLFSFNILDPSEELEKLKIPKTSNYITTYQLFLSNSPYVDYLFSGNYLRELIIYPMCLSSSTNYFDNFSITSTTLNSSVTENLIKNATMRLLLIIF